MITSILKLLSTWCSESNIELLEVKNLITLIINFLGPLISSSSFEIQEWSIESIGFLKLVDQALNEINVCQNGGGGPIELPMLLTDILRRFFNSNELRHVAKGTQQKLQQSLAHDYLETPFLSSDNWNNILKQNNIR